MSLGKYYRFCCQSQSRKTSKCGEGKQLVTFQTPDLRQALLFVMRKVRSLQRSRPFMKISHLRLRRKQWQVFKLQG
ncbi:hypothetical protein Gotur_016350 [Gossypium turneri]